MIYCIQGILRFRDRNYPNTHLTHSYTWMVGSFKEHEGAVKYCNQLMERSAKIVNTSAISAEELEELVKDLRELDKNITDQIYSLSWDWENLSNFRYTLIAVEELG